MSDFWASYISGAVGIIIGSPFDLIKVRLQAGIPILPPTNASQFARMTSLVRGATAPILGYGALNALLFVTYNRTVALLNNSPPPSTSFWTAWVGGAVGGLATWVVSTPTELIKCQAQFSSSSTSLAVTREILQYEGFRGLYLGGVATALRDSIGFGFYFWSYELGMHLLANRNSRDNKTEREPLYAETAKVLLCGGLAGIAAWTSIFPLDVIKTRVQTQPPLGYSQNDGERSHLIRRSQSPLLPTGLGREASRQYRMGAVEIARKMYAEGGIAPFFRGLAVCSVRAFVVNAVQWAVYEWIIQELDKE
jgi:solute carrier family 25 (mitochondrial carnitine/acylcarnitine transporter), member 20/29